MPKISEHRAPISKKEKINLYTKMTDTIKGLIERYEKVDSNRTAELAKPKPEQDIELIKRQTEILENLNLSISRKGYDVKEEIEKIRKRRVH